MLYLVIQRVPIQHPPQLRDVSPEILTVNPVQRITIAQYIYNTISSTKLTTCVEDKRQNREQERVWPDYTDVATTTAEPDTIEPIT